MPRILGLLIVIGALLTAAILAVRLLIPGSSSAGTGEPRAAGPADGPGAQDPEPEVSPFSTVGFEHRPLPARATGPVTGWARLPDGEPVAGLKLEARLFQRSAGSDRVIDKTTLTTADDGSFLWEPVLPPGVVACVVEVSGPDHYARPAALRLIPGSRPPAPVVLELHRTESQRVLRVLGPGGTPVSGAVVEARDFLAKAVTGKDGRAVLRTSPTIGPLSLRIARAGFATVVHELTEAGGDAGTEVVIRLRREGVVAGSVRDEDGKPVGGATVAAGEPPVVVATAADDGTFTARGLDPVSGRVRLRIHHPSFLPETGSFDVQARVAVVLKRGFELQGRVHGPQGKLLVGAAVVLGEGAAPDVPPDGSGPGLRAVSGEDGRYRFAAVPAGTLSLRASYPGLGVARQSLTISAAQTHDIGIPAGDVLGGRIIDEASRPLPGAEVAARPSGVDDAPIVARSAGDGSFLLEGLPAPAVDLEVRLKGRLPLVRTAVPVGRNDLQLVLVPGACIDGTVIEEATRRPVPEFQLGIGPSLVAASSRASPHVPATWSAPGRRIRSAEGRFSTGAAALEPRAAYRLEVRAPGFETAVIDPVVAETAPTAPPLRILLKPGAAVIGRVVRADTGQPVEGAVVARAGMFDAEAGSPRPGANAFTGRDGSFLLTGLPVGQVAVEARLKGFTAATSRDLGTRPGSEPADAGSLVLYPAGGLLIEVKATPEEMLQTTVLITSLDGSGPAVRHESSLSPVGTARVAVLPAVELQISLKSATPALDGLGSIVRLRANDVTTVVFERPGTCHLLGLVLPVPGIPDDAHIELKLLRLEGGDPPPLVASAIAQPDGRFEFRNLEAATYRLEATFAQDARTWHGSVDVTLASGDNQVSVRLSR